MPDLAENRANNTHYHLKHKLFYAQGAVIPVTAVPSLGTLFYSQRMQTSLYATNLSQKKQAGPIKRTKLPLPPPPLSPPKPAIEEYRKSEDSGTT